MASDIFVRAYPIFFFSHLANESVLSMVSVFYGVRVYGVLAFITTIAISASHSWSSLPGTVYLLPMPYLANCVGAVNYAGMSPLQHCTRVDYVD